ncbi:1-deoxy-D-xylulose-5-phosphate synthase N-terminal domain-containing protein [Dactylosporangium sp. CA-152071]|uniref:1-deoxy-D-xylulose-5-phosphate synthase N-terminal domain-containing protein n=1 Tax=Dactylosporangium sp. CA-152071 TaxID=3239933 RepID=UPI003D9414A5
MIDSGDPPDDSRPGPLLDLITGPEDLRALGHAELVRLAAEIRAFLVRSVCRTGGHLGPNLGAVELTIAVHRAFRSPHDRIIFDTGHQATPGGHAPGAGRRAGHRRDGGGRPGGGDG